MARPTRARALVILFVGALMSIPTTLGVAEFVPPEAGDDPPIQHSVCVEDGQVAWLVKEKHRDGWGWFRLFQDHVTGSVYASWEFLEGENPGEDAGVKVGPVRPPEGPPWDVEFSEETGYCQFLRQTVSHPWYRYSVGRSGGGSGQVMFVCAETYVDDPNCYFQEGLLQDTKDSACPIYREIGYCEWANPRSNQTEPW